MPSLSIEYKSLPVYIYFITLATVIDIFTVESVNYLFIGCSTLGLIALLIFHYKSFPLPGSNYLLLIFFFMIIISVWNYSSTRWTSLVYSGFFIISFVFYAPFIQQFLSVGQFRKLLKIVFYLYFIGLVVGQLSVYLNAFTPLSGVIGFMRGSFGTILEKEGIRFFSLSSEPSYASFIVITIFYTYLKLEPQKGFFYRRENILLVFFLLYMIFMFKSAYGVLLLIGLVAIEFVGFSITMLLMFVVVSVVIYLIIIFDVDIKAFDRVVNVVRQIDLSDPQSLYAIDFTAYYRVAPVLSFIESANLADLHFLLGNGAGSSRYYVVPEIYAGYIQGEFLGGFLPAFFYDYGVIGGAAVLVFLARQLPSFFSFPTAVVVLMLLNANLNTQLFWFIVLCFSLLKGYRKNYPVIVSSRPLTSLETVNEISD